MIILNFRCLLRVPNTSIDSTLPKQTKPGFPLPPHDITSSLCSLLLIIVNLSHALHRGQSQQPHAVGNDNARSIIKCHTGLLGLLLSTHDTEHIVT